MRHVHSSPRLSPHCLLVLLSLTTAAAGPTAAQFTQLEQVAHEFAEVHMGMRVRIVLHATDDATARAAARAAYRCIAGLEARLSDYRADSELRRLDARAGAWVPVSQPLFDVLARALDIARATGGAFDPTVAPLVMLWRRARADGMPPEPGAIDDARRLVDWRLVELDTAARAVRLPLAGMRLDLGGIAKGYILEAASATLRDHGVAAALMEAGGDIVVGAAPPGRTGWRIDTPGAGTAFVARAATLTHAALATSGPDFQYLELDGVRYSHVIDPRTGQALTTPAVTRVIAPDGMLADALATALAVLGAEAAPALERHFPGTLIDTAAPARD
jgi:FAD:protein FMN transferase